MHAVFVQYTQCAPLVIFIEAYCIHMRHIAYFVSGAVDLRCGGAKGQARALVPPHLSSNSIAFDRHNVQFERKSPRVHMQVMDKIIEQV